MSYLSHPTSTATYGVTRIGANIDVEDGVISVPQYLSTTSDVTFNSVTAGGVTSYGQQVVTSVTPSAGPGIAVTNVVSTGTATSFTVSNTGVLTLQSGPGIAVSTSTGNVTVNNTGVLSLQAGAGITISTSTGNILISAAGADLMKVYGTSTNYTLSLDDEYVGVSSAVAVTMSLPVGIEGRVYTIKDEFGQGSGKITISPQPGELIDNKVNYIISVPYQSVNIVFRAGQWHII